MVSVMMAVAAVMSFLVSLALIRRAGRLGLIDVPNERSSHHRPTPKGGGIGIVTGFVVAMTLGVHGIEPLGMPALVLIAGGLAVALLGFYSDLSHVSPWIRMLIQTLIAGGTILLIGLPGAFEIGGWRIHLGPVAGLLAVVWLVGVTNFYNFMDGIDGLAAAQAISAGVAVSVFGVLLEIPWLIPLGAVIAGGAVGFLILNVPPARIFMGDVGSYFLGFMFAGIALVDGRLLVPMGLVLGVFIFDSVVTLIRRILNKERWHEAHRSHFYQRAVGLGFSHRQVTVAASVLFILLDVMAVVYLNGSPGIRGAVLAGSVIALTGVAGWITGKES